MRLAIILCSIAEQKTALGHIKHSRDCSHEVQAFIIKSNKGLISEIDKQIAQCLAEIKRLVDLEKNCGSRQFIQGSGLFNA